MTDAPEFRLPPLPVPRTDESRTAWSRWLFGSRAPEESIPDHSTHPWYRVLWLTGVDYFSTLGYQPGIALLAAGALSPAATAILVLVTLLGAVPVYRQVAKRSYAGQGSIAMLENLLPEWSGKVLVLALLGFAATDFVITMTLSAADAAQHAVENPLLHPYLGDHRMLATLALLALLAAVFLKGFREAIGVATAVAVPYIGLNLLVLMAGIHEIVQDPDRLAGWREGLRYHHGDWGAVLLFSTLVFPKLALGLSGFETGVSVMPLVKGDPGDGSSPVPHGRIRNTRRLLLAAALIMSTLLLLSSFVTALLVPPEAYAAGGVASGRAIAYLAHRQFGHAFGTIYDLWTIAILWFAGASAMAGLLNLIPRYLPRFGMAPQWTTRHRPLVLLLFGVDIVVTWVFDAEVEAQGGAYATGVLVLMLSAALAVALALWKEGGASWAPRDRLLNLAKSLYFWIVTGIFAYTLADNVVVRPDGVIIASVFVTGILACGALSRYLRSTELRVSEITFADAESVGLWRAIVGRKVNLVPQSGTSRIDRERKAAEVRRHYAVTGPLAFLHVSLIDNRSEFMSPLRLQIRREGDDFVIEVSGAIAIANTIAYVSELIDPIRLFLNLTGQNLMTQAIRYLLWGEGEVGLLVYKILLRYWEWTKDEDVRPLIFLMSD